MTPAKRGTKPRRRTAAAARRAARTPLVIYVHGIGNKPAPAVLKREWDLALFGTDMGGRTRMAYWADIRYAQPLGRRELEGLAATETESHRPLSPGELVELAPRLAPYGPQAEAYARSLARTLAARARAVSRSRTAGLRAQVLPEFMRRWVTERIVRALIKDTAAYFYDVEQREAIRDRLRRLLLPERAPFLVVAHSQGTIIAHDVLAELGVEVARLVTLGSPLGLAEVQDHLGKPLRIPRGCEEWWNFADVLDPVAADRVLSHEFAPKGRVKDRVVVNRDSLRLAHFNPHSGPGYLATAAVRRAVREVLGPESAAPVTRFVIARDVAAEMADPTERLPVLLELDQKVPGATLAAKREVLLAELRKLTRGIREAEIDPLKRYVAATLTPDEIDRLAARHEPLNVFKIWKNVRRRALIEVAARVVQAYTAQRGYGASGRGIAWAVLDTGAEREHPHFQGHHNIEAAWDCTRVGRPVEDRAGDGNGHGTHVAGIIAGTCGPNTQLHGMAPEAALHVYRVLDDEGSGKDSWIIKALDHIASLNDSTAGLAIHGVNLSLGGPFDPEVYACGHSPICRELRRLWRQGVVVCIAAGNDGRAIIDTLDGEQELNLDLSIGDPANLDEAIAIGSVHRDYPSRYGISYFSSRGPTADGRAKPDLVAPGEKIVSCNACYVADDPSTHYIPMSGTSMACPTVSGILAAFLSVRREFIGYPERVKEILLEHCTDLKRDRYHQGAGMPNLVRMLAAT